MALLHQATVTPTKLEVLSAWVPGQSWLGDTDASSFDVVGAYRFDDPAGDVGIETFLLRTEEGEILQVPLTYRGAPVDRVGARLVATVDHSVLGPRWVYDGCSDPVCVAAFVRTIVSGGSQAVLEVLTDNGPVERAATTFVHGEGTVTVTAIAIDEVDPRHEPRRTSIRASDVELVLQRVLDKSFADEASHSARLVGTWPDHTTPSVLAYVRNC